MSWTGFFTRYCTVVLMLLALVCVTKTAKAGETEPEAFPIRTEIVRQQWNLVRWADPALLLEQLDPLKHHAATRAWAEHVETLAASLSKCYPAAETTPDERHVGKGRLIRQITGQNASPDTLVTWNFTDSEQMAERRQLLDEIATAIQSARKIQSQLTTPEISLQLGRAAYTLQRRLTAWRYLDGIMTRPAPAPFPVSSSEWNRTLSEIQPLIETHPFHATWRTYLRLDALPQMLQYSACQQRELAMQLLTRMSNPYLAEAQKTFLNQPPFATFVEMLQRFAVQRCENDWLLLSIELYESSNEIRSGNAIAQECERMKLERNSMGLPFVREMEFSYRNANLRFCVSQAFVNRILPQPGREERPIQESMFNRPIYGTGTTTTATRVRFIPDEQSFRLAFLVDGNMETSTYSADSMVTVYNDSHGRYTAMKEVRLTGSQLFTYPAVADVDNNVQIRDLSTSLDLIPIVGFVANGVARSQAEAKRGEAQCISRQRIDAQVRSQFDQQLDERLTFFNQKIAEKVVSPLSRLELDFQQIGAQTTEDYASIRWRLAGSRQPGGYTPRPLPPRDSLLNFQVHESALNNFLQQFRLEGRTFTPGELRAHLRRCVPDWKIPEPTQDLELEKDFSITFAPADAVTVKIQDRQFVLCLSIFEMRSGNREWKNFGIEVPFDVEAQGFRAAARRGGVIRLKGRVALGQQVAIRGIFSKMFPKDLEKNLIPEAWAQSPKFSGVVINQWAMQDGWVGISLGDADVHVSRR